MTCGIHVCLFVKMEEELIANTKTGDTSPVSSIARNKGPAQDNDALNDSNVLIPAMAKDIKADIALPKRRVKLQRSRTSALVDVGDRRLSELSHAISSVLSVDIDTHEMLRRFTDKLHQCSMSVEAMLRYNPGTQKKHHVFYYCRSYMKRIFIIFVCFLFLNSCIACDSCDTVRACTIFICSIKGIYK